MTEESYFALIRRLEDEARYQPRQYRFKLWLVALAGYGVLALLVSPVILFFCFLAAAGMWAGEKPEYGNVLVALLLLTVFLGFLSFALRVSLPVPDGIEVRREKAPALFGWLDELTQTLQSPRFDTVLIYDELNAFVASQPRGVLGHRHFLVLGLPLLCALSQAQVRAVLAHEIAHVSRRHSRFAGWIYRVRRSWIQVLEHPQFGAVVWLWFLRRYVPFFNAYSFALARGDEYVADKLAAEVAGGAAFGEALVHLEIKARFLNDLFWPSVWAKERRGPDPPKDVFHLMARAFEHPGIKQSAPNWIAQVLAETTDYENTHPPLRDRLRAIGYAAPTSANRGIPTLPPLRWESDRAAFQLLPDHAAIFDELNRLWYRRATFRWNLKDEPQGEVDFSKLDD